MQAKLVPKSEREEVSMTYCLRRGHESTQENFQASYAPVFDVVRTTSNQTLWIILSTDKQSCLQPSAATYLTHWVLLLSVPRDFG